MAASPLTYWHTLRYLKPIQLYGRLWHYLYRPIPNLSPAPQLRPPCANWVRAARRKASLLSPYRFCFLNESHSIAEIGWDAPEIQKLWRYNQHYFDDLNAEGSDSRTAWHYALFSDWLTCNQPGNGTGWESYPTSRRIVNWIKWALAGNSLSSECVHSLAVQTRWLSQRLETHLLGNHLFANAKALVFAGYFFCGHEADRWLKRGLQIIKREIAEQILSDGGHFERSTMYHALALEDMLDLYNITRTFMAAASEPYQIKQVEQWPEIIEKMQFWLAAMCHLDGDISLFNDAAIGISPGPIELEAYAKRLGIGVGSAIPEGPTYFDASGYMRVQKGDMVAFLDVAPIGPDYLPGHAHADTLSFEMSFSDKRVIVDSGTSTYEEGQERLRQRGTAAHNTVLIDGMDSSEVWGSFRVARRVKPIELEISNTSDGCIVSCAYDGYRRLSGRPAHRRMWRFGENFLEIRDVIYGKFESAAGRLHFHPEVRLLPSSDACEDGKIVLPGGQRLRWQIKKGSGCMYDTTWHPEFGLSIPNRCLEVSFAEREAIIQISW